MVETIFGIKAQSQMDVAPWCYEWIGMGWISGWGEVYSTVIWCNTVLITKCNNTCRSTPTSLAGGAINIFRNDNNSYELTPSWSWRSTDSAFTFLACLLGKLL